MRTTSIGPEVLRITGAAIVEPVTPPENESTSAKPNPEDLPEAQTPGLAETIANVSWRGWLAATAIVLLIIGLLLTYRRRSTIFARVAVFWHTYMTNHEQFVQ